MGKNTMVWRALRTILADSPQFEHLLPHIEGNIGFTFTSGDLRRSVTSSSPPQRARAGAYALMDVIVPVGNTGMEPGM